MNDKHFENNDDFLSDFDREEKYEIPHGYFNSLPDVILNKIKAKKRSRILYFSATIAAACIGLTLWINSPSSCINYEQLSLSDLSESLLYQDNMFELVCEPISTPDTYNVQPIDFSELSTYEWLEENEIEIYY